MELNQLNFAQPLWLWTGAAIPLIWIAYFLFFRIERSVHHLERYIDSRLLPYLLVKSSKKQGSYLKYLLLWTAVWAFLTLALAGPRWSFREIETFSKDQSLVILLDLSESMKASDVKPSRLVLARQKIEDLINESKGVKIGLIAFAADPHMITPLTDDTKTIRHLLPTLDTDIIYIQGSRLASALDMASTMLDAEPGSNKAILVVSDGGYEDSSAILTAKKLAGKDILIYTMGVGTTEGAPLQDPEGNIIKKNGLPVLTKLEKERLSEISRSGNGRYLEANHSGHDEKIILKDLENRAEAQSALGKKSRIWDERFYLLILPVLPIILWWFRRGYIFALIVIFLFPAFHLRADASDYFKNTEQLGRQALENGDYETASQTFKDPYRKGVACYKSGNYADAEKYFRESMREEVASSAGYNLGNSLVYQQKLKEAVTAYEDVLKKWPEHTKAKENLELVKKMLEQQKQDPDNSKQDEENKDQNKDQSQNNDQQDQGKQDPKNDESNQDKQDQKSQESESKDKQNQQPQKNENPDKQNSRDDKDVNESGNDQKQQDKQQKDEKQDADQKESLELNEQDKLQKEQAEASKAQKQAANAPQNNDKEDDDAKAKTDQEADLWLNRIDNDPKAFMKNKFYIESKKNGTTEGVDPW